MSAGDSDDRMEPYKSIKDSDLRNRGICIGEGRFVVERMIDASCLELVSVMCTPALAGYFESRVSGRCPVYAISGDAISAIAGYDFHRGVLAAAVRPSDIGLAEFLDSRPDASRIVIACRVREVENIGSIVRSARCLGFDALIAGEGSADPFNRKAIRASMAGCFAIPILGTDLAVAAGVLKARGFSIVAATTSERAIPVSSLFRSDRAESPLRPRLDASAVPDACDPDGKYAIVLGNEESGLDEREKGLCDTEVTIPIDRRADSLNVGVAAGIFMHYFGKYGQREPV